MPTDLIERLSELQIRRPWTLLLCVALVTSLLGSFASRLELETRYDALLPGPRRACTSFAASRRERRAPRRCSSSSRGRTAPLARHGRRARSAAARARPRRRLQRRGRDSRGAGVPLAARGALPRPTELEQLHDDVFARWDYEVAKESGQLLDDTGPPVTVDDIEERFRKKEGESGRDDGTDGYYERKDGTALVVIVRSPIPGGDLERTGPALARIEATVSEVGSRPEFAAVRVGYAGDMPTGFIEYDSIRKRSAQRRREGHRARPRRGAPLLHAPSRALRDGRHHRGRPRLDVRPHAARHRPPQRRHGLSLSIVAGNGINVGILYQSRYFEERRRGTPVAAALRTAVRPTWQPTAIAALASAASYVVAARRPTSAPSGTSGSSRRPACSPAGSSRR